jgi:predicted MPP superfamily phosphohydrolase
MGQYVSQVAQTVMLAGGRLLFAVLLVIVQAYVLRAVIKVVRVHGFEQKRERRVITTFGVLFSLVNIPLLVFILESLFSPHSVLLYNPAARYEKIARPLAYLFFIWNMGSLFFAVLAPVTMAAFAIAQFIRRRRASHHETAMLPEFDLSRRRFLKTALTFAAAMPFALSAYGAIAARSRNVVARVTVPIPNLPEQLDGFTIVQMSDIHAGVFMTESEMNEYVRIANSLEPDIVALTGDFVSSSRQQVAPFMRSMSNLRARLGVFGCLGNHDMFTRSELALEDAFASAGFTLLRDENRVIDIGGAPLNLIGLDFIFGHSRIAEVLNRLSLDGTTVLLLHAPQGFPQAARMGIDLTLSGHTHGGQIALTIGGLILTPALLATTYLAGLFRIGASHLYVNRGLGTTGPPIRINAPPEITHITLTRA